MVLRIAFSVVTGMGFSRLFQMIEATIQSTIRPTEPKMICFLRRARRCFAVRGAGTGVLTVWCIVGAVLGVKASGLVGCWTLANEIPFMTTLGCAEKPLWIQLIAASFNDADLVGRSHDLTPRRALICSTAHSACSAIKGSGSSAARSSAGRSDTSPVLPRATHTLRRKPRRLIRLIGEFLKRARNSASVSSKYSRNDMPVVDLRAEKAVS